MGIGVKETKELLKFIIDLAEAIETSMEDGDISIFDAANFVASLLAAGEAFKDVDKIPAELKGMNEQEAKELFDYVVEELDFKHDKAEFIIEKAIEIGLKMFELVLFCKKPLE